MTGFTQLLHAEWTKFRTVRGWVIGMTAAAAVLVGLGLLSGGQGSCGKNGPGSECVLPVGPGGQEVTDRFTFVHQPLVGDGSITVRVAALTGAPPPRPDGTASNEPARLVPWAKAGLLIKDGTRPGSTYAAVMVTGVHGVRMQHDYTHDRAGSSSSSPRWLRLTRAGDRVTGAESADGSRWTTIGTARLPDLPSTAQVGLFTTSPQYAEALAAASAISTPSVATATFDHLDRPADGPWKTSTIGGSRPGESGTAERTGDGFTLTGTGDIAPSVAGAAGSGATITQTLIGTFAGLIFMVVIGTMFATAEYRRGLIRTTLAANPARGQILAAKAAVIGGVTFLTGLVAAAIVVTVGQSVLRGNGVYVHPATLGTEVRVVAGTAALLAVAAVLALALGVLLRRSTTAVTVAIVAIVLPYLLTMSVLPIGVGQWLLRITPAAAFAVQQSTPEYDQVANLYIPSNGYFPLSPWAGFAVLLGWTAATLGLAAYRFNRRDA